MSEILMRSSCKYSAAFGTFYSCFGNCLRFTDMQGKKIKANNVEDCPFENILRSLMYIGACQKWLH